MRHRGRINPVQRDLLGVGEFAGLQTESGARHDRIGRRNVRCRLGRRRINAVQKLGKCDRAISA